jgi:ribose transport system permease protein
VKRTNGVALWRGTWGEQRKRLSAVRLGQGGGLLILYLGLIVWFAKASPYFLSVSNFLNIGTNIAYIGIMATLMTLVILSGGFDLSVGAVVALTGVAIAQLVDAGWNVWAATAVGLAVGPLVGFTNSLLITRVGINPLITTLGMLSIVRGLAFVLTGGLTGAILEESFAFLGRGRFLGIPFPIVVFALVFLAAWFALRFTTFGRAIYAVGGNAEAARLAGIDTRLIRTVVYTLSGLSAAVAGIILASQLGAGAPQAATGIELSVIAAVILGGTSLAGGRGGVWGTILGILILGTLNNGLALLSVSSFYQDVARGLVLLFAVALDQLTARRVR